MHEPVHLRSAHLPWFVLRMLEWALHKYLCSFEQAFLALMELHRQGKLEPWPDAPEPARREVVYKWKSAPVAPAPGAGCSAVPNVPKAGKTVRDAAAEVIAPAMVAVSSTALVQSSTMAVLATAVRHPFQRPIHRAWRGAAMRQTRCRRSMFFKPAEMLRENCVQLVPFTQHILKLIY